MGRAKDAVIDAADEHGVMAMRHSGALRDARRVAELAGEAVTSAEPTCEDEQENDENEPPLWRGNAELAEANAPNRKRKQRDYKQAAPAKDGDGEAREADKKHQGKTRSSPKSILEGYPPFGDAYYDLAPKGTLNAHAYAYDPKDYTGSESILHENDEYTRYPPTPNPLWERSTRPLTFGISGFSADENGDKRGKDKPLHALANKATACAGLVALGWVMASNRETLSKVSARVARNAGQGAVIGMKFAGKGACIGAKEVAKGAFVGTRCAAGLVKQCFAPLGKRKCRKESSCNGCQGNNIILFASDRAMWEPGVDAGRG